MSGFDFTGRRVLVTGANRGIGRAVAHAFAESGATVGVHFHRDEAAADAVCAELPGDGHRTFRADLADPDECERLIDTVAEALGGPDVLMNNAGIFEVRPFDEIDYGDWRATWRRTLALNLEGPANLCFLAAKRMERLGGGRIVNVSSRGAFRGEPDAVAYGASKAGLNALTQSLARALAGKGIAVGGVAPGFTETDMTAELLAGPAGEGIRSQSPFGRVARPEEVAHAVLFLASNGAEFSSGTIIDVNGASYLR